MPYKQPLSVLVVIQSQEGLFLLLERAKHLGYWQSVTGSREGEEKLIDTARREVFEETGIDTAEHILCDCHQISHYPIMAEWRHRYAPETNINEEHLFSLQLTIESHRVSVRLSPGEHRSFCWLPRESAAARCFSPSNQAAISRCENVGSLGTLKITAVS